ncbi:MAG: ATP-binding cassette domain-containing protein [Spirochaetales bacterium]|nr:ATP-binding cassette domain-containing protein [Spirochaetales bacterium]
MAPAVTVKGLSKHFRTKVKQAGVAASVRGIFRPGYKEIDAVAGIDFQIEAGEILAFIGPNGAGKSTTIKLITGILYPDAGEIDVLGLNPHRQRRELAYRIGTVFGQKSQLWFHLPPIDSFHLLGTIYDLSRTQTQHRIDFLTEVFELSEFMDQPVRKLSLGQRIRCEMAGSLIHEPEILFLDEPSIGLDVVVKQRIRDLIKRINEERGVTIFLTSHDAGDIEKICRRAMVINHGAIVWDGTVNEMKYSLLNQRILAVRMDGPAEVRTPGARVLKRKDHSMKIQIDLDTTRTETVIAELMKQSSIEDITISATPMEEVITHIYESEHGS